MEKTQLVQYYQWLRQYELNDSHSGNASVRAQSGFWITPAGACADTLSADDLILCQSHNTLPEGASLDAPIHQQIYNTSPEVEAILHAHNPYTIAQTLNNDRFEPVDFEGTLYFGPLPVVKLDAVQYQDVMPTRIAQALKHHKAAIVQSHGVYVGAKSLNLAYKWLSSLEQSAKIKWLNAQLPPSSRV